MELLDELNFELNMPTDSVVQSRNDVVINSPSNTHSPTSNNIIRLYMDGSGFVDPHTVKVFADVECLTVTNTANVIPPSTYELINNIRIIDGSGQVLEEVSQSNLLSQKLHEASSDASFMDCTYGFTNSQKDPSKRLLTKTNFRVSALDVCGLLNQSKYLHLPSFKGLQIEMRLATNEEAFSNKQADNVTFQLTNVQLHYTEVQVSQAYLQAYNEKLMSGGYAISFPTHSHLQTQTGTGQSQITLNKTASRVKSIVSTVRESGNRNNKLYKETATDSRVTSYQYQIEGRNFPNQPVNSASKAYHELLRANYNTKDNRHSNVCWDDWTNEWAFTGAKTGTDVQYGTFSMWFDFEKSSSSPLSGVPMKANSAFLKVDIDPAVNTPVVDSFVCFERVLSVQPDRVVIVD